MLQKKYSYSEYNMSVNSFPCGICEIPKSTIYYLKGLCDGDMKQLYDYKCSDVSWSVCEYIPQSSPRYLTSTNPTPINSKNDLSA